MLSPHSYNEFSSMTQGCDISAYNDLLRRHSDGLETYLCLPQPGSGLRFRLVTTKEFNNLWRENNKTKACQQFQVNGVRLLTGITEMGHPSSSSYPVVSQWLEDVEGLHGKAITYRHQELLVQVYGSGFGSRHRSPTRGTNIYLGTRSSHQSSVSPTEGPGQAKRTQYYRSYYSLPLFRAFMEKRSQDFLQKVDIFPVKWIT